MSPKIMILDDRQERLDYLSEMYSGCEIYCARNYAQAINLLAAHKFELVSLDHDLGDFYVAEMDENLVERTGSEVAEYIKNMPADQIPDEIIIHSSNPVGARRMLSILDGYNVKWRMVSV